MDYTIYFDQLRYRIQSGKRFRVERRGSKILVHPHEASTITLMIALIDVIGTIQAANRDISDFSLELVTADIKLAEFIRDSGQVPFWHILHLVQSTLSTFQQWKVLTRPMGRRLEDR